MNDPVVHEFRIGQSKLRHGLVVAGLGIVAGAATLLLADDSVVADRDWIGGLLLISALAIGVHAWRTGRRPGAHMRVDGDGVYFREWGATVPWGEIADVYQSGSRLQPFVTLRVRDPARLLAVLPEDAAGKLRRNRLWKPPELRIPYNAVEATREEILAAIRGGLADRNPSVA